MNFSIFHIGFRFWHMSLVIILEWDTILTKHMEGVMDLVIDKALWAMGHLVITSGPHAQNRIGSIIILQEIGVMDVWKISQVRTFKMLFFILKSVHFTTGSWAFCYFLFSYNTQENRQRSHSQQHNKQPQTVQLVKKIQI